MTNAAEKDILKRLLIDETEALSRLVQKSERIFKLERKTGEVVFVVSPKHLSDRERIASVLLGRYFATKLELSKSEVMSISDIARQIGLDEKSTRARLSELRRKRIVEVVSAGEYRISFANADRIIDETLSKVNRQVGGRS